MRPCDWSRPCASRRSSPSVSTAPRPGRRARSGFPRSRASRSRRRPSGSAATFGRGQYLGVVGPRSAWLGLETGEAELWVHPLKLASDFQLDFRMPEYDEPIRGADVARTVEVRPEATTITYSHATFTVRQHVLAPLDEPGLLVLLEVDTYRPLEIVASFRTVLQYAWPGGLGGQYAFWSEGDRAFVLSESLRRRNALVGSPWAARASSHPAHALPDAPSTFTIPVDPARAAREMVPIAIAAGTGARADTALAYRRLLGRAREIYDARRRHADALREGGLRIDTPGRSPRSRARVGEGEPGRADRLQPGPGLRARGRLGALGERRAARLRLVLRRRRRHQLPRHGGHGAVGPGGGRPALSRPVPARGREDPARGVAGGRGGRPGSRSTRTPYSHADTTPFWLLALWRQWKASGDAALLGELWPAARKAWAWCLSHDTDGDGIVENTTGGLGAIEVGAIGEDIHQDVYLAAVWTRAAGAMAEMAAARGRARRSPPRPARSRRGPALRSSRATGSRAPGTTRSRSCAREDERHAHRLARHRRRLLASWSRLTPAAPWRRSRATRSPRTGAPAC